MAFQSDAFQSDAFQSDAAAVTLGVIDQTAVAHAPGVSEAGAVSLGLIDQTAVAHTPIVSVTQDVSLGLIDRTAVAHSPSVGQNVSLGLINQTAATFAPSVATTGTQAVVLPRITQTAVIHSPVVGLTVLHLWRVPATVEVFTPSLFYNQTIALGLIDRTAVAHSPVVGIDQELILGLINQTAVAHEPAIFIPVWVDRIDQTAAAYAVALSFAQSVTVGLISQPASAFEPDVTRPNEVALGLITQTAVAHAPTVYRSSVTNIFNVSNGIRTGTENPFTFNSGAWINPTGVVLSVAANDSGNQIVGVTYGGQPMTEIVTADRATGETGFSSLWFLKYPLSGAQPFVITLTSATTTDFFFVGMALTSSFGLEVVDFDSLSGDLANPSVILSDPSGRPGISFVTLFSGHDASASHAPLAGLDTQGNHDYGTETVRVSRKTVRSTGDFTAGFTATIEDTALVAMRVAETANQIVSVGLINRVALIHAPTIGYARSVFPDLITQTAVAHAPSVAFSQDVTLGLIDQTAVAHAPSIILSDVVLPLITQTATTFAPSVAASAVIIDLGLISQPAVARPPIVSITTEVDDGGGPGGPGGGGATNHTRVFIDGLGNVTPVVIWSQTVVETAEGGEPSAGVIAIRDVGIDRAEFIPMARVTIDRGAGTDPIYSGYLIKPSRRFFFSVDYPDTLQRMWILNVADINLLWSRRVTYNQSDPADIEGPIYTNDTYDDVALRELFDNWVDLSTDDLDVTTRINRVGLINYDQPAYPFNGGQTLGDAVNTIAQLPAAVYGINSNRQVVYADVDDENAPFILSDRADSAEVVPEFPYVASSTEGVVTTSSTSWSLTYPSGLADGDLIIAVLAIHAATSGVSSMPGWTFLNTGSSGNIFICWAKRRSDGTESGNFTATMGVARKGSWRVIRIPAASWEGTIGSNWSTGSAVYGGGAGANSTSPNSDNLNPGTWDVENTLWFTFAGAADGPSVTGFPANYTGSSIGSGLGTGNATLMWGQRELAAASENPLPFTISPSRWWMAVTIAVRGAQSSLPPVDPGKPIVGYREMTLFEDGTRLCNDVMAWGFGMGSPIGVFKRLTSQTSIDEHGLWQDAHVLYGVYKQATINKVADSVINGSPQSKRGQKNDNISVELVTFEDGLHVGDRVRFISHIWQYEDVIPVRKIEISFPTPYDVRYKFLLSHEIDRWGFQDPLPPFPLPGPYPISDIPDIKIIEPPPVLPPSCVTATFPITEFQTNTSDTGPFASTDRHWGSPWVAILPPGGAPYATSSSASSVSASLRTAIVLVNNAEWGVRLPWTLTSPLNRDTVTTTFRFYLDALSASSKWQIGCGPVTVEFDPAVDEVRVVTGSGTTTGAWTDWPVTGNTGPTPGAIGPGDFVLEVTLNLEGDEVRVRFSQSSAAAPLEITRAANGERVGVGSYQPEVSFYWENLTVSNFQFSERSIRSTVYADATIPPLTNLFDFTSPDWIQYANSLAVPEVDPGITFGSDGSITLSDIDLWESGSIRREVSGGALNLGFGIYDYGSVNFLGSLLSVFFSLSAAGTSNRNTVNIGSSGASVSFTDSFIAASSGSNSLFNSPFNPVNVKIEFNINGLRVKIWAGGAAEPSAWSAEAYGTLLPWPNIFISVAGDNGFNEQGDHLRLGPLLLDTGEAPSYAIGGPVDWASRTSSAPTTHASGRDRSWPFTNPVDPGGSGTYAVLFGNDEYTAEPNGLPGYAISVVWPVFSPAPGNGLVYRVDQVIASLALPQITVEGVAIDYNVRVRGTVTGIIGVARYEGVGATGVPGPMNVVIQRFGYGTGAAIVGLVPNPPYVDYNILEGEDKANFIFDAVSVDNTGQHTQSFDFNVLMAPIEVSGVKYLQWGVYFYGIEEPAVEAILKAGPLWGGGFLFTPNNGSYQAVVGNVTYEFVPSALGYPVVNYNPDPCQPSPTGYDYGDPESGRICINFTGNGTGDEFDLPNFVPGSADVIVDGYTLTPGTNYTEDEDHLGVTIPIPPADGAWVLICVTVI